MTATAPGRRPHGEPSPEPSPSPENPNRLTVVTKEPLCAETPVHDLDAWITPTERFFVRSHFPVPKIDAESWRLVADGEVDRPLSLSFADLMRELEFNTMLAELTPAQRAAPASK